MDYYMKVTGLMMVTMRDIGQMTKDMDMGNMYGLLVIWKVLSMSVFGKMIKETVKVCKIFQMAINMREFGKMISEQKMEHKNLKMVNNMSENGKVILDMVRVYKLSKMALYTKENLKMIKFLA